MKTFSFDRSMGYLINRTALRVKLELQRAFKENGYDLSAEHWAVLNCLWGNPGMSQTEIAAKIEKDKANLTRILDVMEKRGHIAREPHESDRRSYRIFPTPSAEGMKEDLTRIAMGVNQRALQALDAGDRKDLMRILDTILKNLQREQEQ